MNRCEQEERVLAAFLDGDAEVDLQSAAAHLQACDRCEEALRGARSLDALLAAQTRTDVSEETADRLLSFLDDAPVIPVRRFRSRLAAAAVLAALLIPVVWAVVTSDRSVAEPPVKSEPEAQADRQPEPESTEPAGFSLPAGMRPIRWKAKPSFSAEELRTAFDGGRVPGLTREALAEECLRVLGTAKRSRAENLTAADELTLSASRWLLAKVDRGLLGAGRARLVRRLLLESDGALRRKLVKAYRERPRLIRAATRNRLAQGDADAEAVALLGAVGYTRSISRLVRLSSCELAVCAAQATRTGDPKSLRFLVDLYLEAGTRSFLSRERNIVWFDDLSPETVPLLDLILEERAGVTRRLTERNLCSVVRGRLAERTGGAI